jgi:hypothetical protein
VNAEPKEDIDLSEFEDIEIPCANSDCPTPATWVLKWRCQACHSPQVSLVCPEHKRAVCEHVANGVARHLNCPCTPDGLVILLTVAPI